MWLSGTLASKEAAPIGAARNAVTHPGTPIIVSISVYGRYKVR
jgi:hypothetical protein